MSICLHLSAGLPLMTLSRLGQAVAGVFGAPYLSSHWRRVALGIAVANADARNFSVFDLEKFHSFRVWLVVVLVVPDEFCIIIH